MAKTRKKAPTAVEKELIEGMGEFLDDLKNDRDIQQSYNCRRVVLDLEPHDYKAKDVKKTRELLSASQAMFAQFLGVKVKTVQAWESGTTVSPMACRFMDEIQRDPPYWRKRLSDAVVSKTS